MKDDRKTKAQLILELNELRSMIAAQQPQIQNLKTDLSAAQEELSSFQKSIPDLVYRLDADGCITFINDVIRKYGHDPAALVGKNITELIQVDDLEQATQHLAERRTGERRTTNFELSLKSGPHHDALFEVKTRQITTEPVLLLDAEGLYEESSQQEPLFVGTLGVARDITERKWMENAIRIQRELALKLSETTDLNVAMKLCINAALEISDMDTGGVYLVDETTGGLRLEYAAGAGSGFIKATSSYGPNTPNTKLVRQGISTHQNIGNLKYSMRKVIKKEGLRTLSVIPLKHQGQVIGCMNIASHQLDQISQPKRDALEALAGVIGGTILRIKAATALQESEEKYRILVENNQDGVFIIQDGILKFINDSFSRIFGYDPDELIGLDFQKLIAPEDRHRVIDRYQRRQRGEKIPSEYELTALHQDQKTRLHININVGLVQYHGKIASIGTIKDITERKENEEAMRKSRDRIRALFEGVTVGILVQQTDGKITQANQIACDILQKPLTEMTGQTLSDLGWSMRDDRGKSLTRKNNPTMITIREGRPIRNFVCGLSEKKSKTSKWVLINTEPLFDSTGKISQIVMSFSDITDLKQTEQALKESEEKYHDIFEGASDGIIYVGKSGTIRELNSALTRITGIPREEIIGKNALVLSKKLIRINDLPHVLKIIKNNLAGLSTDQFELAFEGRILEISTRSDKNSPGITGVIRDITERKQAEEALKASEERYRSLMDNAFDAIYLMNNNRYEYVNPRFCQITGYSTEELTHPDFNYNILLPVESRDLMHERWDKRVRGEDLPNQYSIRIINKQGQNIEVEVSTVSLGKSSEVVVLGIMRDVTVRKQAEERLRRSEERYRQLFEDDLTGNYISTPEGQILTCNSAFAKIFGFNSISEAIKSPVDALYSDSQARLKFIAEIQLKGKLESLERNLQHVDGKPLDVIENAVGVFDEEHRLIQIRGCIIDNTERRKLEEQLQHSQKMESIGRLAGGVAHDFNNLLTVISGNTEMALMTLNDHDPLRHDLKEVQNATVRATDLTRQLLAFSRKQSLRPRVLNLNQIIRNLKKMLQRLIGEDLDFITNLGSKLWPVSVDPGQIEQVIINLAVNARDAMPGGGKLIIETQNVHLGSEYIKKHTEVKPVENVMLSITDTGSGMSQETVSQIFDPFFTTKSEEKGTGLGLSTVYGIIKQSGGYIYVNSREQEGTSFKIYLPRVYENPETIAKQEQIQIAPRGTETILVVEDEDGVRNLACRFLKQQGYRVIESDSGGDAYFMCQKMEKPVDLVITDVVMPIMGGTEFIEKLREIWDDVKVLYMSGYNENAVVQLGLLKPETAYLHKPFSPLEIALKVREVLD